MLMGQILDEVISFLISILSNGSSNYRFILTLAFILALVYLMSRGYLKRHTDQR